MDFSIFSKPLSVPGLGKSRVGAKSKEAGERARRSPRTLELIQNQAANGEAMLRFTTTRQGTANERARAAALAVPIPTLEVGDPDVGLSAALENAALLHASGQSGVALQLLAGALANDPDTRCLPRAWHAQFDLLQRADDRAGFEQLAIEYVIAFEASPPPWDERKKAATKITQRAAAGYFAITQINVKTALEIPARAAKFSSMKVDVATVSVFDDVGCRRMVDVLRRLRRQGYPVSWQGIDALKRQIAERIEAGMRENEGVWLFELEIIQWQNDVARFDERAIEYAVTFEVSPPAWEPLPPTLLAAQLGAQSPTPLAGRRPQSSAAAHETPSNASASDSLVIKGMLSGPSDTCIAALQAFAAERSWVPVDMAQVDRIDFVCAGALQNLISRWVIGGKQVRIIGASPIIESLLLLIGVGPGIFEPR